MFDPNNVPQVSIFRAKDMGTRNWGHELLVALMPAEHSFEGVAMKLIQMNPGCSGRFQMHLRRHEYGYVLDGTMILRVGLCNGSIQEHLLEPGDAFHFPPGLPHQEEAMTLTRIMELSTALGNDRVGLESKYHLPPPASNALPDSSIEGITTLEKWWIDGTNYKNNRPVE